MNWEPPKNIDILYNIHKNRTTHIKKPFHYKQFPYQYKNYYYYQYTNTNKELELNELNSNEIIDIELNTKSKLNLPNSTNKNIKQKIFNHQLYFYEDFIEYNIIKDYCKLFNKSFNIPRQDWASPYHFFLKSIPINTQTTNGNTKGANIGTVGTNTLDPTTVDPNTQDPNTLDHTTVDPTTQNTNIELNINELRYIDDIKKKELLYGEIPQLFDRSGLIRLKQKKDCWISYHNLKNYALMIDSVTKCPLLIVQSKKFLQQGWYDMSTNTKGTGKGANSTAMECTMGKGANFMGMECTMGKGANSTAIECTMGKGANFMGTECTTGKGTPFGDKVAPFGAGTKGVGEGTVAVGASTVTVDMSKYNVKKEIIEEMKRILKERKEKKEEELPDVTKLFKSKSYGINENCYTIGGGRYHI
uniref:Chromosome segregation (SMC) protein, putative n=1 Tax=Theileria annulata TaxID=5874 RepID=A0A3B0NAQ6_THEAN